MRDSMRLGPRVTIVCKASLVGAVAYASTPEDAQKFLQEQVCDAIGVKLEPPDEDLRVSKLTLVKMVKDLTNTSLQEAKINVENYLKGPDAFRFRKHPDAKITNTDD